MATGVFVVLSLACCSLRSYGYLASKTPYFYSHTGDTLKAWRVWIGHHVPP